MKNKFCADALLTACEDLFDGDFLPLAIDTLSSIIEETIEQGADPISPDEVVVIFDRLRTLTALLRKLSALKEAM